MGFAPEAVRLGNFRKVVQGLPKWNSLKSGMAEASEELFSQLNAEGDQNC